MAKKKSIIKSLYDWRILIAVFVLYRAIEFFTTPFGGGSSGFPFKTCTHGSVIGFQGECDGKNIILNLLSYYIVSVLILIVIRMRKKDSSQTSI